MDMISSQKITRLQEDFKKSQKDFEKRFSEEKSFVQRTYTILGMLIASLPFVGALSIASVGYIAKSDLNTERERINKALGNLQEPPKVNILTQNREKLSNGREILATLTYGMDENISTLSSTSRERIRPSIRLNLFLKNEGKSMIGAKNLIFKIYTKDPLKLRNLSSDESDYKYETIFGLSHANYNFSQQTSFFVPGIPSNASINLAMPLSLNEEYSRKEIEKLKGSHNILIKVYYSNISTKNEEYNVNLKIDF